MGESFHGVECSRLSLLSHYVFDSLGESGIISVPKDGLFPSGANSETIELDVVFDDMLVIVHLQLIDAAFGVSGWIDGSELISEDGKKSRPVVHPNREIVSINDRWFEELEDNASKVR